MQFLRLRDGDRFFFTHRKDLDTKTQPLGSIAKKNVLKRSLGGILCDNLDKDVLDTKIMGKKVFNTVSDSNPKLDCHDEEQLDFDLIFYEAVWELRNSLKSIRAAKTPKEGVVQSPNYPEGYPNNISMETNIIVEEGYTIELTLDSFDLEDDSKFGCRFDYVKIVGSSSKLDRFCGIVPLGKKYKFISSGPSMKVTFHTDESITRRGFKATWTAVPGPSIAAIN